MMSLLARFAGKTFALKGLLLGMALALFVGFCAGGWLVWKFSRANEVRVLEAQLTEAQKQAQTVAEVLADYYEGQLAIKSDKVTADEIEKHVPDNRACDLGPDAVRLLNRARVGMPEATRRPD